MARAPRADACRNRDRLLEVASEAFARDGVDASLEGIADADELAATKPPVEALAEFMQRFVAYVATKKGLATHLKSVVSADSDLFTSSQDRVRTTVGRMVAAAIACGGIRADADAEDLIRALAGVCMTSDLAQSQDQPCRIATLLMDGLRFGAPASA